MHDEVENQRDVPLDNIRDLEKQWGIPQDHWSKEQWRAAAKQINWLAAVYLKILEHRVLPEPQRRRGRRPRVKNALCRPAPRPVGAPRKRSLEDDYRLVAKVAAYQEILNARQSNKLVSVKDAIDYMVSKETELPQFRRWREVSRLQKQHSRSKKRIAEFGQNSE